MNSITMVYRLILKHGWRIEHMKTPYWDVEKGVVWLQVCPSEPNSILLPYKVKLPTNGY